MCKHLNRKSNDTLTDDELEKQMDESCEDKYFFRIISICDILDNIGKHHVFKHRIFTDPHFISLIKFMLQSNNYLVKMNSTRLIRTLLECDHKKYGSLIKQYDEKDLDQKTIPRLLFEMICKVCILFFEKNVMDEETNEEEETRRENFRELIRGKLYFESLSLLYKGILKTCF